MRASRWTVDLRDVETLQVGDEHIVKNFPSFTGGLTVRKINLLSAWNVAPLICQPVPSLPCPGCVIEVHTTVYAIVPVRFAPFLPHFDHGYLRQYFHHALTG